MQDRKICSNGLCGGGVCPTIVNGATIDRATANGYEATCTDGQNDLDLLGAIPGIGPCDLYDGCAIGSSDWVDYDVDANPFEMCVEVSRQYDPACVQDLIFATSFE